MPLEFFKKCVAILLEYVLFFNFESYCRLDFDFESQKVTYNFQRVYHGIRVVFSVSIMTTHFSIIYDTRKFHQHQKRKKMVQTIF